MNLYIASTVATAIISSACTYQIQQWRFDARELEHAEQTLVAARQAADAALERERVVTKAQNLAALRLRDLRASVDSGRVAIVSLHDAASDALRSAETSHAACLERANTFSVVLGTMAATGGEIAAKADLHASDLQTLTDAWLK